ncbi:hypothetical protein ZWY2020_052378 [Hordeum vulgare]|nr:hypothetical protein ZWY2020_052378 [Hordeum vulgare]
MPICIIVALDIFIIILFSVNCSTVIFSPTVLFSFMREASTTRKKAISGAPIFPLMAHYRCATIIMPLLINSNGAPLVLHYLKEKENVLHIHNKPNVGYRRGITEFADGKLRKPSCSDLLDLKIAKEIDHLVQAIIDDNGKLYKRVFADYKLVQDRLYVHLPKEGDVKTITSNP